VVQVPLLRVASHVLSWLWNCDEDHAAYKQFMLDQVRR
jgi:hypothetical protein